MFTWIKALFGKKPAAQQEVKKPRQRRGTTLSELVLLELKRGGHGTVLELAERLNANAGSIGNVMADLERSFKVRRIERRSRHIVWGLA